MHDTSELIRARIDRFQRESLEPGRYRWRAPLTIEAWEVPGEPVPFSEARNAVYSPFAPGTAWGRPWGTTWFHVTGRVPEDGIADGVRVEVVADLGFSDRQPGFQAEALAYRPDGRIVKGIAPRNAFVPMDGLDVDLYIEAASNPDISEGGFSRPTDLGDTLTAPADPLYTLRHIDVAALDLEVWRLCAEFTTLRGLMAELDPRSARPNEILHALERAVDAMDPEDVAGTAADGRAELAGVLAKPASASAHRITAVGHAHIDSAWLWPVRETIRKCARTFSTVLALMDEHPDFVFACSSAQQFAWIKEYYPELFERIRVRVREGRFVPVGGMWVESDANLPSGESMARQFLTGKGFFLREFGIDPSEVWLPDSFGYSGALPQIMRAAGARYFLTQKLSWNETNVFPHHTFSWEGIDGSRILTHFPPVDSYNSDLSAAELARAERNYAEKGEANSSLVPFGYGDGGGGPTREMLQTAELTASLEGSPAVTLGSPRDFFQAAESERAPLPVWTGELYLELHRGTYTSQARTKRGNRRSEALLHEAELWATTAAVRTGAAYPYERLDAAWKTVLLAQFHDILPGSSIAWVYRVAEAEYERVERELEDLIAASLSALDDGRPSAFNASPVEIDGVPPLAADVPVTSGRVSLEEEDGGYVLENDRARFVLDASGRIVSAVDLAGGRDAIPPGMHAAELQLFRDTPNQWEAWDIDEHYRRHGHVVDGVDAMTAERTDGRVAVRVERSVGRSRLTQEFALAAGGASLEITTRVDWHERRRLLKLAFPLDVHTLQATSEVQYGHIVRAITENTSWDAARFETNAHRWVHVGEPGFGVAIANDAVYGHDVTRHARAGGGSTTLVRQSLLRAPLFPDPEADQGEHLFRSSLRVGAEVADAIEEGYRLNLPLRTGTGIVAPLVAVENPAVIVEAVKLAEDRSGDVIVRLYEARGARAAARMTVADPIAGIDEVDLLERPVAASALASVAGQVASLVLRPFQLVTLRLRRA